MPPPTLTDGPEHRLESIRAIVWHTDDNLPRVYRRSGQLSAVEHEVRSMRQEHAILGARGFPFHCVHDDYRRATGPAQRFELPPRRKTRSAPSGQARRFDLAEMAFHPPRIAGGTQWRRTVLGEVRVEGSVAVEPSRQQTRRRGCGDHRHLVSPWVTSCMRRE